MLISFSPMRRDDALTLERRGDVLVINGRDYDLGHIGEGETLSASGLNCAWLVSDVQRREGILRLTLILPHGADAPLTTLFPAPLRIIADGPVPAPGAVPPGHAVG